jgi:hypothetical protein
MNVVDAEPLDGVDFKNGVLAYIQTWDVRSFNKTDRVDLGY